MRLSDRIEYICIYLSFGQAASAFWRRNDVTIIQQEKKTNSETTRRTRTENTRIEEFQLKLFCRHVRRFFHLYCVVFCCCSLSSSFLAYTFSFCMVFVLFFIWSWTPFSRATSDTQIQHTQAILFISINSQLFTRTASAQLFMHVPMSHTHFK